MLNETGIIIDYNFFNVTHYSRILRFLNVHPIVITMFACKPTSGRHKESKIWNYFEYDAVTDKSKCLVSKDSAMMETCFKLLSGKNSTILKTDLKTFHKSQYAQYEASEQQSV